MLKIRSTPTEGKTAQMKRWMTESRRAESPITAFPNRTRDSEYENSLENTPSNTVQPPLPRLDLLKSDFSENREESQIAEPLCTDDPALEPDAQNAQHTPHAPGTHKSTHDNFGKPAKSFSDFYL